MSLRFQRPLWAKDMNQGIEFRVSGKQDNMKLQSGDDCPRMKFREREEVQGRGNPQMQKISIKLGSHSWHK